MNIITNIIPPLFHPGPFSKHIPRPNIAIAYKNPPTIIGGLLPKFLMIRGEKNVANKLTPPRTILITVIDPREPRIVDAYMKRMLIPVHC